jgi:hypothetical protein
MIGLRSDDPPATNARVSLFLTSLSHLSYVVFRILCGYICCGTRGYSVGQLPRTVLVGSIHPEWIQSFPYVINTTLLCMRSSAIDNHIFFKVPSIRPNLISSMRLVEADLPINLQHWRLAYEREGQAPPHVLCFYPSSYPDLLGLPSPCPLSRHAIPQG